MISTPASTASAGKQSGGHNKREEATRDLDDGGSSCVIDDNGVDVDVDDVDVDVGDVPVNVDDVEVPTQKPHFLDDAMPPPDMVADFERILTFGAKSTDNTQKTAATVVSGEQLKMDKKYERDGEISDYELAASGYTKKEFTQDDNTLNLPSGIGGIAVVGGKSVFTKPKHFLDENPIPPDYMLYTNAHRTGAAEHLPDLRREHHSLDRNFERREEEQKSALLHASQLMKSISSSSGSGGGGGGRKSSLDRLGYGGGAGAGGFGGFGSIGGSISYTSSMSSSRTSRERNKDHSGSGGGGASYTLARFLHSAETPSPPPALQRSGITTNKSSSGGAWTHSSSSGGHGDSCSFDRLYGSLPMTSAAATTASVTAQTVINTNNTLGGIGSVGAENNINSLLRDGSHSIPIGGVDDIVDVDRLGPKVECVYSLLSMLGSNDPAEMSKKFLELSRSSETCSALRRAGCVPLLVQMMHSADGTTTDDVVRKCASMALHNVVHSHPDEKAARREAKVLRLLEQILDYCNFLKTLLQSGGEAIADDSERHPLAAISSLMKVSFDEEHRHAMCELGALQAIPNLVHLDHAVHGPKPEDQCCNSLRRYALMALTNLTFGDEHNKAYLCSQKLFMEALVAQLDSAPDDLLQVTASVLRNLSWRADSNMKAVLNEIGTVTALARAAMKNKSENTLKAILSALWNLSAHCSTNKAEFCAVDGALAFLVDMLTYEGPSKTLKIIENAGGILRNVSSHIAVREHYRQILRERNCLAILLQQLKSESLTVVSNSCGTLWNLSARCPEDQKFLWDNGAVPMLRSLIHSKHAMISEGSASALKNLLNFRPAVQSQNQLDPIARSMGLRKLPTLNVRKQKALQQELGGGGGASSSGSGSSKLHAETCDNLDLKEESHNILSTVRQRQRYNAFTAPGTVLPQSGGAASTRLTRSAMLTKSESRDSVFSAKSDTAYENFMRSHSASEAAAAVGGRSKKQQQMPYAAGAAAVAAVYTLENDVEATDIEQPIDYSAKYCEKDAKITTVVRSSAANGTQAAAAAGSNTTSGGVTYQETDLDQPTDFSLRYAEQQIETELDVLLPPPSTVATEQQRRSHANFVSVVGTAATDNNATVAAAQQHGDAQNAAVADGNEILLILGDTVKCYQTEDTPYVISNAASVTDLRQACAKSSDQVTTPAESSSTTSKSMEKPKKCQRIQQMTTTTTTSGGGNAGAAATTTYGSGSYTPEKPINYCEEGTPGYFSRYESLSSLDESPPPAPAPASASASTAPPPADSQQTANKKNTKTATLALKTNTNNKNLAKENLEEQVVGAANASSNISNSGAGTINSAQETPLMFSRHSSMDSLVEEGEDEIGVCDDKSSVVSDFSRLASGVISPSEIPDSPTQSMPQSPRRSISHVNGNSACGSGAGFQAVAAAAASLTATRGNANDIATSSGNAIGLRSSALPGEDTKRPLRSVFEDGISTFNVENTPAQFSCRTSLSNLSILDDEHNSLPPSRQALERENNEQAAIVSEGEEEDEECADNHVDDILLANCINVGMNCTIVTAAATKKQMARAANRQIVGGPDSQLSTDEPKHYYTEDTPALLSKVGSNTNLSAISICSSNSNMMADMKELQPPNAATMATAGAGVGGGGTNRHSLALSDDVSSNASESGDLLQQCIEVGMKKPLAQAQAQMKTSISSNNVKPLRKVVAGAAIADVAGAATSPLPPSLSSSHQLVSDPIAMLRRGGNVLPPYLPVSDEMSKYLVEDSPCNFSVASGLSNLTVGSSLVGPAVQLKGNKASAENIPNMPTSSEVPTTTGALATEEGVARMEPKWQDDSLSSLSIDSEDDTNLLSQAIAAGCNRPKSNLGFSRASKTNSNNNNKRLSLSASQPIPINAAASSTSSLNNTSSATARHYQRQQQQQQQHSLGLSATHDAPNLYQNGNDSYSSVDSSDSNDNQQAKSLFELCIRTGMHKSTATTRDNANNHHRHHHHRPHLLGSSNNRRGGGIGIGDEASNTTQSNPNLKQFDLHNNTIQAKPTNIATATGLPVATTTTNRHLRERERKDEKLLLECINTGISKKIGGGHHSSSSSNSNNASSSGGGRGAMVNDAIITNHAHLSNNDGGGSFGNSNSSSIGHMGGSKNVLATSAAAPVLCHQHAATLYSNVHSTAAPDVAETNTNININSNGYNNSSSSSNVIISSSSNINTATAFTTTSNSSSNSTTIIHNNDTSSNTNSNTNSSSNNVNCLACWAALKEEQEQEVGEDNNKHGDIIDVAKSQAAEAVVAMAAEVDIIGTTAHNDVNPPNHVKAVIDHPNKMNVNASDIGCKKHTQDAEQIDQLPTHEDEMISPSFSFDNTVTSDDSNESFIIETTVSLDEMRQSRTSSPPPHQHQTQQSQKHKDPDLMLKSVERLTMEFVASAEQLRTNSSNITITTSSIAADGGSVNEKQMPSTNASSISIGGGGGGNSTSNNTWNEDTCPNDDVSFPSLSITAPVVASLKYDDDDDDDDDVADDQATDVEHKDLHDFAEITPINEEQSKVSLMFLEQVDACAHATDAGTTQPSSLETETETDTLVNDGSSSNNYGNSKMAYYNANAQESSSTTTSGSGINFQLGGAVKSAAALSLSAVRHHNHMLYGNNGNAAVAAAAAQAAAAAAAASMTNSAIIAIEARALAENLQNGGGGNDTDHDDADSIDLTFSVNSLDLDNIRPPSGMESLNISGYYCQQDQQQHSNAFPHSLGILQQQQQRQTTTAARSTPQSPQMMLRSPKFPRKSLPHGLVAKRALGQMPAHLSGSAESVNSSCNILLENIKPPSLMDELLDSMISVASIQSEVADGGECSLSTTLSAISNYETAAIGGDGGEYDDNTITLQSCYDTMPHDISEGGEDNSFHSGAGSTPLPTDYDYEFSSAESTPRKSAASPTPSSCDGGGEKRTLTPKQKRKVAKDRYKTYTISSSSNICALSEEEQRKRLLEVDVAAVMSADDETLQIEIVETEGGVNNAGSTSRRRVDAERYRTQTIVYTTTTTTATTITNHEMANKSVQEIQNSDDDCHSENISSLRALTQKFKFINMPNKSSITVTAAPEAQANEERGAPDGGDCTSMECDQNSETESCHDQRETYTNKHFCNDQRSEGEEDEEEENEIASDESDSEEHSIAKPAPRARIAKPLEITTTTTTTTTIAATTAADAAEEHAKVVRGRKKPAYISPYSMQYQQRTGSPQTRIAANKALTTATTQSNAAAAQGKRDANAPTTASEAMGRRLIAPKKGQTQVGANAKAATATTTTTVAAAQKVAANAPPPLERQGTFVQEEPTIATCQVPVVVSDVKTATAGGSPQRSSKLPTKRTNANGAKSSTATTTTTAATQPTTAARKIPIAAKSGSPKHRKVTSLASTTKTTRATNVVSGMTQRSNSNASIRVTGSSAARIQRISATTPPTRSNSCLNSRGESAATAAANSTRNAAAKINQAQSRIANIWKRVNDVKSKQLEQQKVTTATPRVGNTAVVSKLKMTTEATNAHKSSVAPAAGGGQQRTTMQQRQQQQKQTLIRSSTFDNTPNGSSGGVGEPLTNGGSSTKVAVNATTTNDNGRK